MQPIGHINMSSRRLIIWHFVIFATLSISNAQAEQQFTNAKELMRHIDRMWRSDSSYAVMSMQVKTARYERTMEMEAWSQGKEKTLFVIKAPRKDKGIATLKVENNIWNYLPKIRRVSKIPASMMSGSWMGSHFTNDDLVKENTYEDDYDSEITFQGMRDNQQIIEVTSSPKPNAAVVWGKVITVIDKNKLTPVKGIYFDEEGKKVREMLFDQEKLVNGNTIPMRMKLIPLEKPDESTIVTYHSLEFDIPIKSGLFSLKNLQKRR